MARLKVDNEHIIEVPDDKLADTQFIEKRVQLERDKAKATSLYAASERETQAWEADKATGRLAPEEVRRYDDLFAAQRNELRRNVNMLESEINSIDEPLGHALGVTAGTVGRGVASVPAFALDVLGGLSGDTPTGEASANPLPLTSAVQSRGEMPVSQVGKMLGHVGEAAASGGFSLPKNMMRNAVIGAGAGVGAEATGAALGTDDPILKSLGAMALGVPTAAATGLRKSKVELARGVHDALTPDEMQAALEGMRSARDEGMQTLLNQHVPRANALDDMVAALSQRSAGKPMTDVLREQPASIAQKMGQAYVGLEGETGGSARGDLTRLATETKQDLTSFFGKLRAKRGDAYREKSGEALAGQQPRMEQEAAAALAEYKAFESQHGAELKKLEEAWRKPRYVAGKPDPQASAVPGPRLTALKTRKQTLLERAQVAESLAKNPEAIPAPVLRDTLKLIKDKIDSPELEGAQVRQALQTLHDDLSGIKTIQGYTNVKNDLKAKLDSASLKLPPAVWRETGVLGGMLKRLDNAFGPSGTGMRAGKQAHIDFSETQLNPLTVGIEGKAVGRGTRANEAENANVLFSALERGTTPGSNKSEIKAIARRIQPTTLYDNAATWFNQLIQGKGKTPGLVQKEGLRYSEELPAKVSTALSGAQGQGLRDLFSSVGNALQKEGKLTKGQVPNFVRGIEVVKRHADLARIRPNRMQEINGRELDNAAGLEPVVMAGKLASPLARFSSPLKQVELALSQKAYTYISEQMTTPEGVETLLRLAKVRPGSPQAEALLQGFLANSRAEAQQESSQAVQQ